MGVFDRESSKMAWRADFVVYGAAALGLASVLLWRAPGPAWPLLTLALAGYLAWGLLEYALHRFVLHGLQPFRGMHEQHHRRPVARIGTPTVVSAPLFALLVFAPAWALSSLWPACAWTLGLLAGYLAYTIAHHACHQISFAGAWFGRNRRWHARHHRRVPTPGCYGVSHRFWDHVFGTDRAPLGRTGRLYRPSARHI